MEDGLTRFDPLAVVGGAIHVAGAAAIPELTRVGTAACAVMLKNITALQ